MTASLPDRPLSLLWQATVVDVEPATAYGHRYDGAAVNTTLAIVNDTGSALEFPLILATTDPEDRDPGRAGNAVTADDPAWADLARALRANALAQGYAPARVDALLVRLRASVERASKSRLVRLEPDERLFVRTHQRKLLPERAGGIFELSGLYPLPQFSLAKGGEISVVVVLPAAAEALDWAPAAEPQTLGGRAVLSWSFRADPELAVSYRYRR